MNIEEGLQRIAKVINALGWIWVIPFMLGGVALLFSPSPGDSAGAFIGGIVGFLLARATAWVIRGFASPKR
ncbi:hypothetical protein [Burkholderia lata]|uniref:hypothetical protein n=1 Tax=Burkholderia lata (strain ATCC 17760 / DSM 23089 / LMG 22485 / NCIMB 9086 / R18194 / 383) TaxID=482957 RepID=UPI001583E4DD|nr:hypothetical protein [Burkholderia lata]